MTDTQTQEDLSWLEWVILGFLTGFVLVTSWIITLACYLASPSPWVKADRVVGTLLARALNSHVAEVAGTMMLVILVLATIAMTLIVMDKDAAAWAWENAFSRPWWPMPK